VDLPHQLVGQVWRLYPGMNSKFFFRNSEDGFSFPELVCAMGIVATVLVVMIGTLISGLEALQKGTGYNHAAIIAQRSLEIYNAMDYSLIPVNDPVPGPVISSEEGFTIETRILEGEYPPTGTGLYFKKVIVTVSKKDITNPKRNIAVRMYTFLRDDGK